MKLSTNNFRKSFGLLFSVICLVFIVGTTSCSSEESILEPATSIATDDASLLKWQMEKFISTRASSYDIALITTKTNFNFSELPKNRDYFIDWGDGIIDTNKTSHTYTDGLPAHTIFLRGDFSQASIDVNNQEIIFADISRTPGLFSFAADENRLTNIDLSKNTGLCFLELSNNNLHSIDVSNNKSIFSLSISHNNISEIDVTKLFQLYLLFISGNQIDTLDVSMNDKLNNLTMDNNLIRNIDLKNNPLLSSLYCNNCPISNLDFSGNPQMAFVHCSGTQVTNLDFSHNPVLSTLNAADCKISNITLPPNPDNLDLLIIKNNPIEQELRKMTSLALILPDRSGMYTGEFRTVSPYVSTVASLLAGLNWEVKP